MASLFWCDDCSELHSELTIIKRRCASFRTETLALREEVKNLKEEKNMLINEMDQIRAINARYLDEIKAEKKNVSSVKQDLERLKKVAMEQREMLKNYTLAFNLMKVK